MTSKTSQFSIIAVQGGFYFFGREVASAEGFLTITEAALFGGFGGGKGMPGVARGDAAATVTLDRFDVDAQVSFPLTAVFAIVPAVNLYEFKGTKLR